MFDFIYIYYLFIKWLKVAVLFAKSKKSFVAVQLNLLGTAAYTAAFVYAIEKGLDFNVLKLAIIGVAIVTLAHKLNR
jgi:hypothetical protein